MNYRPAFQLKDETKYYWSDYHGNKIETNSWISWNELYCASIDRTAFGKWYWRTWRWGNGWHLERDPNCGRDPWENSDFSPRKCNFFEFRKNESYKNKPGSEILSPFGDAGKDIMTIMFKTFSMGKKPLNCATESACNTTGPIFDPAKTASKFKWKTHAEIQLNIMVPQG